MALPLEVYTHPALNISNFVTVKHTKRNYILWKTQFELFLSGQNLLRFFNGAYNKPPETLPVPSIDGITTATPNLNCLSWHMSYQVVKVWLLGPLAKVILTEVVANG